MILVCKKGVIQLFKKVKEIVTFMPDQTIRMSNSNSKKIRGGRIRV